MDRSSCEPLNIITASCLSKPTATPFVTAILNHANKSIVNDVKTEHLGLYHGMDFYIHNRAHSVSSFDHQEKGGSNICILYGQEGKVSINVSSWTWYSDDTKSYQPLCWSENF